jgi:hypothetical protein
MDDLYLFVKGGMGGGINELFQDLDNALEVGAAVLPDTSLSSTQKLAKMLRETYA